MIAYIVVALILRRMRGLDGGRSAYVTIIFDSSAFATSLMLLIGIVKPEVMVALGNTKLFLVIAGIAGFVYSLYALFPARPVRSTIWR